MVFKLEKNRIIISFGIRTLLKNKFSIPNKNAIFIFGFQKSGTSAIAGLLAAKTGKSVTIDTKYFWNPYYNKILSGEIKIENHVKKYSYPFSKDIIKEPASTFFIPQLREYFYLRNNIFIVRNPFDNIRSILNRLNLPGDNKDLILDEISLNWRYFFEKTQGEDYIKVLAERWVDSYNQIELLNSENYTLVKYEDFIFNKELFIENLAQKIGLEPKYSIKHIVNKQFQPPGMRFVNVKEFFGIKNYAIIEDICGDLMKKLDY